MKKIRGSVWKSIFHATLLMVCFILLYAYNLIGMPMSTESMGLEKGLADFLSGPHFDKNYQRRTSYIPSTTSRSTTTKSILNDNGSGAIGWHKRKEEIPVSWSTWRRRHQRKLKAFDPFENGAIYYKRCCSCYEGKEETSNDDYRQYSRGDWETTLWQSVASIGIHDQMDER